MIIGVPKEIKNNENRVAMTPGGVSAMVTAGHKVYVETNAGVGSGFEDHEYEKYRKNRNRYPLIGCKCLYKHL